MILRRGAITLIALLLAVLVVRNGAVQALAERRPAVAYRVWSVHPKVEISLAMIDIARAAHGRRPVPPSSFAMLDNAAAKDPLAPEPFLVRGVQFQLSGDNGEAERMFAAAQWRDPRSLPAAYFLADRYVRTGDVTHGLREFGALARLSPNGNLIVAPYLAAFARNPANWPALRQLFAANRELAGPALATLADNRATVPAVLALAQGDETERSSWLPRLLTTLTSAGDYARARAIWASAARIKLTPGEWLYDREFVDTKAPTPFNWALASSTLGLAERQRGGRLHIVYYGQEDGFLASELLLLPAGNYRLTMQLLGDKSRARALNWSIWCDKAPAPIGSTTLDAAADRGWTFIVPKGCAAQWLKLGGSAGEIARPSDLTIGGLNLQRAGAGA